MPYGQIPQYAAFPQQKSTNGLAIASFVLGLLSIFACWLGVLTGVIGLVLGFIGLRQTNADPERVGGRGLAIAGIVLSGIATVLWVGFFIVVVIADNSGY